MRLTGLVWVYFAVVPLAFSSGCHRPLRPVFPLPPASLVWPPPPAPARIRYVGQLSSSADLNPARKAFQGITDVLFGAKQEQVLYGPRAIVTSDDGRYVWIADPGGRCLHGFDLVGRRYRKLTTAGGTKLLAPVGISLGPSGTFWVCDSAALAIHRFSIETGAWRESLRVGEDLHRPTACYWLDPRRELYVVDTFDHNVKVLDEKGRVLRVLGTRGGAPGSFNFPTAIASDGRTLWIADTGNHRVQEITLEGVPIVAFGQAGTGPGDLAMPKSVALDSDGHVYVVDARFENIQVFAPDGTLLLHLGEEGADPGEFWLPGGIFVDRADRIWVCDTYNHRVQVFDYVRPPTRAPGASGQTARE